MTKQEEIREGIAIKLSFYALEAAWRLLNSFRKQIYLDQALAIMEYEASQGVAIKVKGKLPEWFVNALDEASKLGKLPIGSGEHISKIKAGYTATEPLIK